MTSRRNVPDVVKRYALPGAVLLVVVIVLPVITFLSRRQLFDFGGLAAPKQTYGQVAAGTLAYDSRSVLSLAIGPGQQGIGIGKTDSGSSIAYEVAVPGVDGDVWVVDHPNVGIPGARVRRYDAKGKLEVEFRTPAGTTLFTPGVKGDLWVDQSSSSTSNESLLHYSDAGKLLATYVLPERLLARTIQISPEGRVYVGVEQYWVDPSTGDSSFAGELVPLVEPDGKRVGDIRNGTLQDSFIGMDGNYYNLTGTIPRGQISGYPTFSVTVRDASGKDLRTFELPHGLRPFAADAQGRVYAEGEAPTDDAPGQSVIGDPISEYSIVHVFDNKGKRLAQVAVQRTVSMGGWAPDAFPDAAGRLYSTNYTSGRFEVVISTPVPDSGARVADGKPRFPDARIIITDGAPITADPYLAVDAVQRDAWKMVYSGLVSHDTSLNATPDLCVSIPSVGNGVSADGRRITWKIRDDRTWHDGEKVTAKDVVATWDHLRRRIAIGAEPFPGFDLITDVKADGDEVTVELSEPFGAAPECFFPYVLPAHLVNSGKKGVDLVGYSAPVGSGPYKVSRFEDTRWMLTYAGGEDSAIERIDVEYLDAANSLKLYQSGSVPTLWTWVPVTDADKLERDAVGTLFDVPTGRWAGAVFNTKSTVLNDASVRRGLLSVYPFEGIRSMYSDEETQSVHLFTRGADDASSTPGVSEPTSSGAIAKSASAAVKPLVDYQKALPGKRRVYYAQTHRADANEILAEQVDLVLAAWKAIGVDCDWIYARPKFYSNYAMRGFISQGDAEAAVGTFPGFIDAGWGSLFDPDDIPSVTNTHGLNVTRVDDIGLRQLIDRAETSYDVNERRTLTAQIESRVADLGLVAAERTERRSMAVVGIEGIEPGVYPAGDFWNIQDWRLE